MKALVKQKKHFKDLTDHERVTCNLHIMENENNLSTGQPGHCYQLSCLHNNDEETYFFLSLPETRHVLRKCV